MLSSVNKDGFIGSFPIPLALFFWSVLGLCCYAGFPLISANRGLLLFFGVHGLLIVMASLVAEHGL